MTKKYGLFALLLACLLVPAHAITKSYPAIDIQIANNLAYDAKMQSKIQEFTDYRTYVTTEGINRLEHTVRKFKLGTKDRKYVQELLTNAIQRLHSSDAYYAKLIKYRNFHINMMHPSFLGKVKEYELKHKRYIHYRDVVCECCFYKRKDCSVGTRSDYEDDMDDAKAEVKRRIRLLKRFHKRFAVSKVRVPLRPNYSPYVANTLK